VLRRKSQTRVRLWNIDRLLLVWLYRLYPSLLDAIGIIQPETVIRWHRRGFRAYWHWKSRHAGGRPRIDSEVRALVRRMSRENPLWGAPRIHGELLMLGIEVAELTVGRYMVRRRRPPSQGLQLSILAHNLMRSFQLHTTLATPKPRSRKRTYSYRIASMKTLRFLLINRAARLARISGHKVLRFSSNPATQTLYDRVANHLAA
jgi:hypothetical protein